MMKKVILILIGAVLSLLLVLRTSSLTMRIETRTVIPMLTIFFLLAASAYVVKNWNKLTFERNTKDSEIKPEDLPSQLKFECIVPREDYIAIKRLDGSLQLFRFIRVVEIPYSIEDMEKDRKLWMMENVARLLSAINFECRLIHSIKPYDREIYLRELKRKREELQVKIEVQGKSGDLETKLRLYDRVIERLVMGEQAFDDDIVLQIMVSGHSEAGLLSELGKNTKMLQALLESSLNLRTRILQGHEAWSYIEIFLGAS